MRMDTVCLFTSIHIQFTEKFAVRVQCLIISKVSWITVTRYEMHKGINYSTKHSITCT